MTSTVSSLFDGNLRDAVAADFLVAFRCYRHCGSVSTLPVPLAYLSVLCNCNSFLVQCGHHPCFCKRAAHVRLLVFICCVNGNHKVQAFPTPKQRVVGITGCNAGRKTPWHLETALVFRLISLYKLEMG